MDCTASVISPISALPLVTAGAGSDPADFTPEQLGTPYAQGAGNTWTTGPLPDGIYVAVGTCGNAEDVSYGYNFAFIPGSILGTIPQFFDLGSTVLTMDGGMDLITEVLSSDMLGGSQGSDEPVDGDQGTDDPGADDPGAGDSSSLLDGLDLGSLSALMGGGAADVGAGE